jgi:hypothetical protein
MKTVSLFQRIPLRLLILVFFSFAAMSNYCYSQTSTDFSGTWKFNQSKSSPIPNLLSLTLLINQKGNSMVFTTSINIKDQKPLVHSEGYNIGEDVNLKSYTKTGMVTSSWSSDKSTFSITETYASVKNGTKNEFIRIASYALTDQGRTLIIVTDDSIPILPSMPDRRIHKISVYNK